MPHEVKAGARSEASKKRSVKLTKRYTQVHRAIKQIPEGLDEEALESSVSMASMLINPKQAYEFRLSLVGTQTATVGGNVFSIFSWDPNAAPFPEWTYITQLFSQVRIVRAKLTITPANQTAGAVVTAVPLMVATNLDVTTAVPSSAVQISQLADSHLHNLWYGAKPVVITSPTRPNSLWADTANTSPGPDTGCYGGFWVGNAMTLTSSIAIFYYHLEILVEVRARD